MIYEVAKDVNDVGDSAYCSYTVYELDYASVEAAPTHTYGDGENLFASKVEAEAKMMEWNKRAQQRWAARISRL